MKPGETLENAIWLTGEETQDMIDRYHSDVEQTIDEACDKHGLIHAPVTFVEKRPGDDRVPPVPDHIHGLDVRLLVVEADIVGYAPKPVKRTFVGELESKDLRRLRQITQAAHQKANGGRMLSITEIDDIIEELGPDTALRTLGSAVH